MKDVASGKSSLGWRREVSALWRGRGGQSVPLCVGLWAGGASSFRIVGFNDVLSRGQVHLHDGQLSSLLSSGWGGPRAEEPPVGGVHSPLLSVFLVCCCSVAESCPTLCDPMDCSMPGSPVLHYLPEFAQTLSTESVMLLDHLVLCCPLLLLPSVFLPASGMSWLFASGDQSIGASTSVLPMNTQDWSPLGWTSWISLQSKGVSRVFSNTTVKTHHFLGSQLSL